MKLTSNTDFFQKKDLQIVSTSIAKRTGENFPPKESRHRMKSNAEIIALIKQTSDLLDKCGFGKMSARANQIIKDINRERFAVSVVGEFNHGKSTFVNRLLENAAMLPVSNLPTTAILTRIRYANEPKMAVFDDKGVRQAMLAITQDSWKGLVANNFSEEQPRGSVIVGVPNSWLGKHNIEIIDCPGAGDLSEERAKVIGDVLWRSDGTIIALNARAALSNNEKIFIRNRILSRKTPFTLIIVNKLDLVKKEERSRVIKYIKDVLALNKMDIPVYVPYDIEMPDDTYSNIIGMDKVKKEIVGWINHPRRQQLIETWVKARVHEVISNAIDALVEHEKLLKLDDVKRKEVIDLKKQALNSLEIEWNELALKLQTKSNECYARFLEKVEEYTLDVAERLQYEVSHAAHPEKWWNEDYPYRLKVELANMSVGLENTISKIINNDVKWFNDILNQKFRSFIQVGNIYITEKDEYKNNKSNYVMEFENLNKKQNYARIGTVALSLILIPTFGPVATLGIGTAGTLLTSTVFKKKIEEQHVAIKEAIAKDIPAIIMQATANSEKRIQKLYDEMLEDSDKKKQAWLETQREAIEKANPSKVQDDVNNITENIASLTEILNKVS
jgi:ribosome biogenesis GTPase A/Skp family chaperone for outer membrane proteins